MKAWQKWDCVKVSGDGIGELIDWTQKNTYRTRCKKVLDRGVVEIEDTFFLPFEFEEDSMVCSIEGWYKKKDKRWPEQFLRGRVDFSPSKDRNFKPEVVYYDGVFDVPEWEGEKVEDRIHKAGSIVIHALWSVLSYMGDGVPVVERKVTVPSSEFDKAAKKAKRKGKRKPRKLVRTEYAFRVSKIEAKRIIQRQTEAWTVRGHWRNLKGGGQTWVRPHVKGDPAKLEASEYKLEVE